MVCTDVASRGLDFKRVNWVLHFDLTATVKDYINRVGRTARIAENGQSICFVLETENRYPDWLQKEYDIKLY